jgi:phosphate transport system protein
MISTRASFIHELSEIDQKLLRMGGTVRGMVADAVASFLNGELQRVESVFSHDDIVDDLEADVEVTCLRLLALQQPMARDLRRVSSAIKVGSELERMGDHAVDIVKNARKIHMECFPLRPLIDLERMSTVAEQMLDDSLTAFIHHDIELVETVCVDDDIVDAEYKKARRQLIDIATDDPGQVAAATYTLLVAGSIERIADHATNIAERVAYLETGQLQRITRLHKRPRPNDNH